MANQNVSPSAGYEGNHSTNVLLIKRNTTVKIQLLAVGGWQRFFYAKEIPNVSGYIAYSQDSVLGREISQNQGLYEEIFNNSKKPSVFNNALSLSNKFIVHALVLENTDPDGADTVGKQVIMNLAKDIIQTEFSSIKDVHVAKSQAALMAAIKPFIGGEIKITSTAVSENALPKYKSVWTEAKDKVKLPELQLNVTHFFNFQLDERTNAQHTAILEEGIRRAKQAPSNFPNLAARPAPPERKSLPGFKISNKEYKEVMRSMPKEYMDKVSNCTNFMETFRTTRDALFIANVMDVYKSGDLDEFVDVIKSWEDEYVLANNIQHPTEPTANSTPYETATAEAEGKADLPW